MLSKKRPPVVDDSPTIGRVVQQIYTDLNEIINAVNQGNSKKEKLNTEGKSGDIRVVGEGTDTFLEIKTEEGWKTPVIGKSAITFKDKPAVIITPKKESINEIESNDTTTGSKEAEKVIFDEKAGKFVLARPDYKSDWIRVVHASYKYNSSNAAISFTHNLEVFPSLIVFQIAPDEYNSSITSLSHGVVVPEASIDYFTLTNNHLGSSTGGQYKYGIVSIINKTTIYTKCGNAAIFNTSDNLLTSSSGSGVSEGDGAIRVLLWK